MLTEPTPARTPRTATGEATLSPVQVQMLREMLDEQWKFRTEQIAEITRQEPSGPRRRQTLADHEVLDTVLFGARQALREINSARQRMTDGSYGYCTSCGKMLRIERLEIVPQTALCLSCQRDASSA